MTGDFYTKSGRIDEFVFEKISVWNLDKSLGEVEGVVGGSLTFDYYTDLKVSGSLDVAGAGFVNNCLIRVWLKSTLGGTVKRQKLCTCMADTTKLRYENGAYSGTIELRSVLARHLDDKLHKNYVLSKKSALTYFRNIFKWLGGKYKISGVKDKKFGKNVVMGFGKTPMDVLWKIADYLDGEITVDAHGRTVLQKYVLPKKRPLKYTIPSGAYSVTLPGYDLEDTTAGTPNRAAVKFSYKPNGSKNEKTLFGLARVADSSTFSYAKTGRVITECYELSNLSPKTQKAVDAVAKKKLASIAASCRYYEIECFYLPIHIGEVVRFKYDGVDIDALVASIDMELSAGGKMKVRLRRLRKHG